MHLLPVSLASLALQSTWGSIQEMYCAKYGVTLIYQKNGSERLAFEDMTIRWSQILFADPQLTVIASAE